MTYQEAIAYIWGLEKPAREQGLQRMRQLTERLGNLHLGLRAIHLAGTNGKGSVTAYLDAILQEAGYRVGRFTSPDLHAFNERICINGERI